MRLPSLSSIRRTTEELPSPQAISLRQLQAGSWGWASFQMAIMTLLTLSNTWRANSCRLVLGMSLLSSNHNGDLGPRNCAFPNSSRVGGFQNIKSPDSAAQLDYRELENSVKLLFVVPTLVCAMTTIIPQVNSAPTSTPDALPPSAP